METPQIAQNDTADSAENEAVSSAEPLLMDLEQAAAFLGIPASTLHTWAWQGRVPCVRLGRRRFFRRKDLERWVDNHLQPARKRRA